MESLSTFGGIFFSKNQVFALLGRYLVILAYSKSVSSRIDAEKAAGSLRESTFLEESLLIITLGVVDVLESKLIFFSSVSPEKDKAIALGVIFLDIKEVETLLKEYLAIWWVWDLVISLGLRVKAKRVNLELGWLQENLIENSVQDCLSYILKPYSLCYYYFSLP